MGNAADLLTITWERSLRLKLGQEIARLLLSVIFEPQQHDAMSELRVAGDDS